MPQQLIADFTIEGYAACEYAASAAGQDVRTYFQARADDLSKSYVDTQKAAEATRLKEKEAKADTEIKGQLETLRANYRAAKKGLLEQVPHAALKGEGDEESSPVKV